MAYQAIELTIIDREILASYSKTLKGLAIYLGEGYEIVLHSLENYEHSIINIINGEHTGRKIGAPITDLALNMLEKIEHCPDDFITYFSTNKKGEPLKSTTIAIRGEKNRIIGLLCMNLYLNTSIYDIMKTMISCDNTIMPQKSKETFVDNSEELIESTLNSIKEKVFSDDNIVASNKNKMVVYLLEDYGIFNIKDSVIQISNLLGISKNTVYMHLRNKQSTKET